MGWVLTFDEELFLLEGENAGLISTLGSYLGSNSSVGDCKTTSKTLHIVLSIEQIFSCVLARFACVRSYLIVLGVFNSFTTVHNGEVFTTLNTSC